MSTRKNFDLEKFPENRVSQRMISRVSPIYERSYVAKWLYEVMGQEVDDAEIRFSELREQANPETATWGLRYWEQRYGIEVDESRSLAARRADIIARRGARAPMNPERLKRIIQVLTHCETIVEDYVAPYTFGIFLKADNAESVDIIQITKRVKKIKPSHMDFRLTVIYRPTPASAHAAAAPCSIASRYTVRLPDFTALPDAQAQAYAAGAVEHMRKTVTIKIGGSTL